MKTENLKGLTDSDIVTRRAELMRELMVAQFQLRTGQLENSAKLKGLRRGLARLNTELRARELANGLRKGTLLQQTVSPGTEESTQSAESAAPARRSRFGLGFIRDTLLGKRS